LRLHEEGIRILISAALISFMVVAAAYLWLIELSEQGEFGAFLGAELTAFSMLLYLYTRPSYAKVKKIWFLVGCLSVAFFLTLAIIR